MRGVERVSGIQLGTLGTVMHSFGTVSQMMDLAQQEEGVALDDGFHWDFLFLMLLLPLQRDFRFKLRTWLDPDTWICIYQTI